MKNLRFISFWLLLTMGLAAVVFNACDDDEPSQEQVTSDDPNDPDNPDDPTDIAVASISLDKTTLTLMVGNDYTLTAAVLPNNATNKTVTWTSGDDSKATVANGKVTAIAVGSAVITAKAGNEMAVCTITSPDPSTYDEGVVIAGKRWATRNVDRPGTFAANPEDGGMFYQWNRTVGWSTTNPMINSNGGTTWDNTYSDATTWETTNNVCPAGWRIPTQAELASLVDAGSVWTWPTLDDVPGRKFGSGDNTVFLPCAGNRGSSGGGVGGKGHGCYWSSTGDSPGGMYLSFNSGATNGSNGANGAYGFSVRCVAE